MNNYKFTTSANTDLVSKSNSNQFENLLFVLNKQIFAIPVSNIVRSILAVEITSLPKAPDLVLGVINYYGEFLPIISLNKKFGFTQNDIRLEDKIIIVKTSKRLLGILVDDILELSSVNKDNLLFSPVNNLLGEQIKGVAHLNDEVVLIYDLEQLLSIEEEKSINHLLNNF